MPGLVQAGTIPNYPHAQSCMLCIDRQLDRTLDSSKLMPCFATCLTTKASSCSRLHLGLRRCVYTLLAAWLSCSIYLKDVVSESCLLRSRLQGRLVMYANAAMIAPVLPRRCARDDFCEGVPILKKTRNNIPQNRAYMSLPCAEMCQVMVPLPRPSLHLQSNLPSKNLLHSFYFPPRSSGSSTKSSAPSRAPCENELRVCWMYESWEVPKHLHSMSREMITRRLLASASAPAPAARGLRKPGMAGRPS